MFEERVGLSEGGIVGAVVGVKVGDKVEGDVVEGIFVVLLRHWQTPSRGMLGDPRYCTDNITSVQLERVILVHKMVTLSNAWKVGNWQVSSPTDIEPFKHCVFAKEPPTPE